MTDKSIFVVVVFRPSDPDNTVKAFAFKERFNAELQVQDYAEDALFDQAGDDYHVSIHQMTVK